MIPACRLRPDERLNQVQGEETGKRAEGDHQRVDRPQHQHHKVPVSWEDNLCCVTWEESVIMQTVFTSPMVLNNAPAISALF